MYGITTIQKLNAQNREAQAIIEKHEREREAAIRASIEKYEARKAEQDAELAKA